MCVWTTENGRQFVSYLQAALTSRCLVSGLLFSYFCYKFPLSQAVAGDERSPDARGGKEGGERMRRMSNDRKRKGHGRKGMKRKVRGEEMK